MKEGVSDLMGDYFTKVFVLGLSLLVIVPTAFKMYDYFSKRSQSIATEAVVLIDPAIGSDLSSRPVVRYTDHVGKVYEHKSKINFYWIFSPKKGDKLTVYYNKDSPGEAFIDSLYHYIILPFQLFLMGAVPFICVLIGRIKKDYHPAQVS